MVWIFLHSFEKSLKCIHSSSKKFDTFFLPFFYSVIHPLLGRRWSYFLPLPASCQFYYTFTFRILLTFESCLTVEGRSQAASFWISKTILWFLPAMIMGIIQGAAPVRPCCLSFLLLPVAAAWIDSIICSRKRSASSKDSRECTLYTRIKASPAERETESQTSGHHASN